MDFLLKKISDKKQGQGVEHQAISLGLVQGLNKQISANELAAKGIKLSLRDQLVGSIKDRIEDKIKQHQQPVDAVQQMDVDQPEQQRVSVQEFMEKPLNIAAPPQFLKKSSTMQSAV